MNTFLPIIVLISGNGTNLQAIIDAITHGRPIKICAVISNKIHTHGLQRAKLAHIPTYTIPHNHYPNREAFESALVEVIQQYPIKLLVLAGFMRQLTPRFVARYQGMILNIHPSLLPKYPGLNPHERVLNAGDSEHGASIHLVTAQLDQGPIIYQAKLSVTSNDTVDSLKQRVKKLEHLIYPEVLFWIATNRLTWDRQDQKIKLDGKLLPKQGLITKIKA